MREQIDPNPADDSLDRIERLMAIEEALIRADPLLTPGELEWMIHEIEVRIERGEFRDESDFDDDALVRNLGPRSPRGQAGAAVTPDEFFFE